MAIFAAQRSGVSLSSPDLADILKAACAEIPCLANVIKGRQDDVLRLEAAVRSFLEREETRSLDPSLAETQRPPKDTRRTPAVTFAPSPTPPSSSCSPSAPPPQSPVKPKSSVKLLAVAAEVMVGVCCNCGMPGHRADDCVTAELFPKLGRGPNGVWHKGEREEWARALPPDVTAAIVAGVRKKIALKKSQRAATGTPKPAKPPARVSPRAATVNTSHYVSFEARARVGSAGATSTPALADTGTPPNFVSAALAKEIVQAGNGTRVPAHVRISRWILCTLSTGVQRAHTKSKIRVFATVNGPAGKPIYSLSGVTSI